MKANTTALKTLEYDRTRCKHPILPFGSAEGRR